MPLISLRTEREETWRYVAILPPVNTPEDLIHLDKGQPLPVATARKILQAIRRNEPCGEADGFAWQYDMRVPTPILDPFPVSVELAAHSG